MTESEFSLYPLVIQFGYTTY